MDNLHTGKLNDFSEITSNSIKEAAEKFGTPFYLYDEKFIKDKCAKLLSMPNAYGLTVRYAMKANPNRTLLKIIHSRGLKIDASSLNEARRAQMAGIDCKDIILTTQEVPAGAQMTLLQEMMRSALKYNVCSLRQLYNIGGFAAENKIKLAVRIHPGIGAGESASRNTGDDYSCFGIHRSDFDTALNYANEKGIIFDHVHVHIGSGGSAAVWKANIDLELNILEKYFPHAETVSFGGGLKEARMPFEEAADIAELGAYAKERVEAFCKRTKRKLKTEIEPGTFIAANAGYAVTKVIDKKQTGAGGLNFIITDGGMEINARPLMYGSVHPFYAVSKGGGLLFSEFGENAGINYSAAIIGRCCESGDSQCLDENGTNVPRKIAEPEISDYVVIGGAGAYCSAMAPMNYNSHLQAPEILLTEEKAFKIIRKRQTFDQLLENEE
jgi:diaminopimelate decarboxylase